MIIGVPTEVKTRENRVAMVPGGVKALVECGHEVLIQKDAGLGAGISNELFQEAGAKIIDTAEDVWKQADMVIKVKEPIASEFKHLRKDLILYTYLHLAAEPELAKALCESQVTGIAYETIQAEDGSLPLLKPMSEVAGRMAVQVGAQALQKHRGGKGVLLGGVPGVKRGRVAIIGGGIVGVNSAKMAIGLGAQVAILDVNQSRLAYLDDIFGNKITTLMSTAENLAWAVAESDLVVGAVLITGAKAPKLVTREMVASMEDNSAIVDVAIDQGGCIETIRPTTHDDPIYVEEGVLHYGVTNIPGDVPRTSTYALTNVTLKYALEIANKGYDQAIAQSEAIRLGVNTYGGYIRHKAVAEALGMEFKSL